MNYLDLIIGIVLIASAVEGYKKGMISQITSLVSLIVGIVLAIRLFRYLSNWMVETFSWGVNFSVIFSFILIFILTISVIAIIGRSVERTFEEADLNHFNKIGGIVLSLVKSLIFLSALMLVLSYYTRKDSFPKQKHIHGSYLYMPVSAIVPTLLPYINKTKTDTIQQSK